MDKDWLKNRKSENGRIVPISHKIIDIVKKKYNPETKRLIEIDGKPVTYYQFKTYIWQPAMEQLELKHTIHETRHTGTTLLSNAKGENGEPIDSLTIKYIVGHKTDTDITERYTHRRIEQLVDAIDRI